MYGVENELNEKMKKKLDYDIAMTMDEIAKPGSIFYCPFETRRKEIRSRF